MIIDKQYLGELLAAAGVGTMLHVESIEEISDPDGLKDFRIEVGVDKTQQCDSALFTLAEVAAAVSGLFGTRSSLIEIDASSANTYKGAVCKIVGQEITEAAMLVQLCNQTKKEDDLAGTPEEDRTLTLQSQGWSEAFRKKTTRCLGYQIIWVGGAIVKPRQLKRFSQLKGLKIESIKTVLKGAKVYIKTTCGGGLVLEGNVVKQDLSPDENIAIGLLTKEDLASIAKAKKMGLIP